MREEILNLPGNIQESERSLVPRSELKNKHWRLQKALDMLLKYLMDLEVTDQVGRGDRDQEKDGELLP